MPTARKPKSTSAESKRATPAPRKVAGSRKVDWTKGVVTPGGGVAATISALRRTRGPGKKPAKEQVAIRLDQEVLGAFRAGGRGWQTRVNAALKEWLAKHPQKRRTRSRSVA